jgi:hypothetical protein
MRRYVHALTAAVLIVGGSSVAAAQAADPAYGVWKLDVAKSKFSPGPAPKEMTVTVEGAGAGRKVSVVGVAADGSPIKWGYTGNLDSKDVRITGTHPDGDVVMMKRVAPNATRTTFKLGGKRTIVSGISVSADGKTLTVATTGVNAKGQTVNHTHVFDKQ